MDALAALGVVLPITLIIQAFANLIGLGGAPRASMKLGEDDTPEANKLFNSSFVALAAIGVVLSVTAFFSRGKSSSCSAVRRARSSTRRRILKSIRRARYLCLRRRGLTRL